MSSLEKFAKFAQPDKLLMVGEALVGTDSVAQARNFNAAFGSARKLDGFIISKCDTVGDMVRNPLRNIWNLYLLTVL
jgi:signal recognition particle receptor subunit alpha